MIMTKKFYLAAFMSLFAALMLIGCATHHAPVSPPPSSLKEISPISAYQFQKDKKAVIVDVREENETSKGRVKDSVLLPLSLMKNDPVAFKAKVDELKKYNSVIVYCQSGRRAGIVGEELKKNGLDVYNMGGFDSWKNQKLPTE